MTRISKQSLNLYTIVTVLDLILGIVFICPCAYGNLNSMPPVPNPLPPAPAPTPAPELPAPTPSLAALSMVTVVPLPSLPPADLTQGRTILPQRQAYQAVESRLSSATRVHLQTVQSAGMIIRMADSARTAFVSEGVLRLQNGEICLETFNPVTVLAGSQKISLTGHSVTLIDKESDCLIVRNLYDEKSATVRVIGGKESMSLQIGQEAVINFQRGNEIVPNYVDSIARRRTYRVDLSEGASLLNSEISLIMLLRDDPIMSTLRKSGNARDRDLIDRVLKSAVIVNLVTAGHGQYHFCRPRNKSEQICSVSSVDKQ
jgi:hypothetical protein